MKNNLKILHLLKQPTYEARIEWYKKYATRNQLVFFGIMCAESVLHIFEKDYPKDSRVRDCINLLKSKIHFTKLSESEIEEIKNAAYAAANSANSAAYAANSAYAAYASAHAAHAADAANAAAYAATAAANSANSAAYAATAATYAAYAANAAGSRKQQEARNTLFMITVLSGKYFS